MDKFLWSVRVYKTRAVAAEEIKKNRVAVAGSAVKASREVKGGDVLEVKKNGITYQIKVLDIPKSRIGAKLVADYVKDQTDPQQYEALKIKREEQNYYRQRGEGRPTKKDRRDISDFTGGTDWDSFFEEGEED